METDAESQEPIQFSDAELAMIDQGVAELDRGEGMSFDEAHELARKRTQAWMKVTPTDRSA